MPTKINIVVKDIVLAAELFDTVCATKIAEALPITASPHEWGDEFYFDIPVAESLDDSHTNSVCIGDIGYWPPGRALAIFFGPTPISTGSKPVPASDVNLVGVIKGDASILRRVKGAAIIRLERS